MSEENPTEHFPINPLHSWLRVMLWVIPTGFVFSSAALGVAGQRYLGLDQTIATVVAWSSFFLCLIGAGWSDFKIAGPGWKGVFSMVGSVVLYVICQMIFVTIILCLLFSVVVPLFA